MTERRPVLLLDGLVFPEGPRWRASDNLLYFSDVLGEEVVAVGLDGERRTVVEMDEPPSGLGFMPNGDLLIVATGQNKVVRLEASLVQRAVREGTPALVSDLVEHGDVSTPEGTGCNDMVVAADGTAYVGTWMPGLDEAVVAGPGNMPGQSFIVMVRPDGSSEIAADRMTFPNGACISPDGRKLVFAETFGFRLTAFDIGEDGSLSNKHLFADLGAPTDGICMDAEGAVWTACPYFQFGDSGGYVRVADGGKVLDVIRVVDDPGKCAYACMLGGPERKHLFLCESTVLGGSRGPGDGRVRVVEVDVPGAGIP